ncbi:MAG: ABC transporter substrate-binding protein [Oligoflexales bacterium]
MRTKIYFGMFIIFAVVASCWAAKNFQGEDKIRIVFGGGFGGGLNPTNFKTLNAAYVSDLVFPPLIGSLDVKQYFPRIAESWEINEADTFLSFTLDSEVAFSNGDPLRCKDVKKSLEHSISIRKQDQNFIEDFRRLKGYSNKNESIEGIQCSHPLKIEFHSQSTNTNLLEALSNPELGIHKIEGSSYIGCGNYHIKLQNKDYALLERLKSKTLPDSYPKYIEYVGSDTHRIKKADVFVSYSQDMVPEAYRKFSQFEITWMARLLYFYRHEQSIFANELNRKALQALFWQKNNMDSLIEKIGSGNFIPDPQPFLQLQPGRINDEHVIDILQSGKKDIQNLIVESKRRPIKFVHVGGSHCLKILDHLKSLGLAIDDDHSRELDFESLDFEPADIQCVSYSECLLKRNMIHYMTGDNLSPPFEDLLSVQRGNNKMNKEELAKYLREISKVTLDKVPFIIVGRAPLVAYYNERKIRVRQFTNSALGNSILDRFYIK